MDHDKLREAVLERTESVRTGASDIAFTDAERLARQMDIVDLIVNGATLRHCADHFKIAIEQVRTDYTAGLDRITDHSIERTIHLREEVTARQRELILANMARAKAGDRAAAAIVQNADHLLASIWGLRSIRVVPPRRRRADDALSEAVEAYLTGLTDAAHR